MFKNLSQLHKVGIGIFLVALLLSGVLVYNQSYQKAQVALPESDLPQLSFILEPETPSSGTDFDLIIQANPNDRVFYAFELYFTYDPAKAEIQNKDNPTINIISDYPLIRSNLDSESGHVEIVGARLGSSFNGSENIEIARVHLKSKVSSLGSGVFNWQDSTKIGSDLTKNLVNF